MTRYLFWGGEFRQDTLTPNQVRFAFWVALFVAGNLVFPALVHSVPMGGPMFLPLYFFTLIAAYRYGLWAGLVTAALSPTLNHLLTGMPPLAVLDVLLVKSAALAVVASLVAHRSRQVSLGALSLVIISYQFAGGIYEAVKAGSLGAALGDWVVGWPGLLIQLVAGGILLGIWGRSNADQTAR